MNSLLGYQEPTDRNEIKKNNKLYVMRLNHIR